MTKRINSIFLQFGEMPFHMVRSRRFKDLYEHVLFNYEWLHAKLSSCPLQAVLADFEDASINTDDKDSKRELMLVADALRLGGAILAVYPNMLAAQLIGRVFIFELNFLFVGVLLFQCDLILLLVAFTRNRWKFEYFDVIKSL